MPRTVRTASTLSRIVPSALALVLAVVAVGAAAVAVERLGAGPRDTAHSDDRDAVVRDPAATAP